MSPNRSRAKRGEDWLGGDDTEAADRSWGFDHTLPAKREEAQELEESQEFPQVQLSYLPKASSIVQRGCKAFVRMSLVMFFLSLKYRQEPWMPSLFSRIIWMG